MKKSRKIQVKSESKYLNKKYDKTYEALCGLQDLDKSLNDLGPSEHKETLKHSRKILLEVLRGLQDEILELEKDS